MNRLSFMGSVLLGMFITAGCSSSDETVSPTSWEIGEPTATDYPEDYYAGGLLGTTAVNSATAFEQPTKAVENAGMMTAFNEGEYLFEKEYNTNTEGAFHGLGPVFWKSLARMEMDPYAHGATIAQYVLSFLRGHGLPDDAAIGPRYIDGDTFPA